MSSKDQSQFYAELEENGKKQEYERECVNVSLEICEKAYRTGFAHGYYRALEEPENEKKLNVWLFLTLNDCIPFPGGLGCTFEGYQASPLEEMKFKQGFCKGFRLALKNKDLKDEINDWRHSDYSKIIIPPGHEFAGHVWGVKN